MTVEVRRLSAIGEDELAALAEVLVDCVDGGRRVGVIPGFALMPDGAPCATTVMDRELE